MACRLHPYITGLYESLESNKTETAAMADRVHEELGGRCLLYMEATTLVESEECTPE